jgi:hypothetical protein
MCNYIYAGPFQTLVFCDSRGKVVSLNWDVYPVLGEGLLSPSLYEVEKCLAEGNLYFPAHMVGVQFDV